MLAVGYCIAVATLWASIARAEDLPAIQSLPPIDASPVDLAPPAVPAADSPEAGVPVSEQPETVTTPSSADAAVVDATPPLVTEHVWYEPGF